MEHYDGSPNFDSLFTAAESKTGTNSNTYNVECSVTVRQNIDTKNVVHNQYRMTVGQQGNLQRQAMANNINNRMTAIPELRLDEQKITPSPNIVQKEVVAVERKFSNSLTVGPGVTRSSSLREPRGKPKNNLSPLQTPSRTSSRNNLQGAKDNTQQTRTRSCSLPDEEGEVEVTRQFLAVNKKVINRGDSFRRKDRPTFKKSSTEGHISSLASPPKSATFDSIIDEPSKIYRVAFLGSAAVGKTSIIDQFMSSEHSDVYENDENRCSDNIETRMVKVDVNNSEAQMSVLEASVSDLSDVVDDHNPDCFVIVYAVDDMESFEYARHSLTWLSHNNHLSGKSTILVGNKTDLARSRVVETSEGCNLAVKFGVKFTETSPGMGHHIDELLVGIVMQLRLLENTKPRMTPSFLKQSISRLFNIISGKEDEKRKLCRNLNV